VFKLFHSSIGERALADLELLKSVSRHKSVFFAATWAKYDEAIPGTLRLVPPDYRLPELEKDYAQMRSEMIFGDAAELSEILKTLGTIQTRVNKLD
jgi:hypothetical protein